MAAHKYSIWIGSSLGVVLVILFALQIAAASANPDFDDYSDYDLAEAGPDKRHLGSIAALSGNRGYDLAEPGPDKRHLGSIAALSGNRGYDLAESGPDKRHLGSIAALSGYRGGFSRQTGGLLNDMDNNQKYKRFLGSLARGGWFPRQFRGFVGNPGQTGYQQKRHIGAVARLGWLPSARSREDYGY